MKRMHIISILTMVLIYIVASNLVNMSFILPRISEIMHSFFVIVLDVKFFSAVFATIYRFLIGVSISFILALVLSVFSFYSKKFREFMEPIYIFLKTIPNITYIIVSILWLGRNGSVILVSSLVIFPIMYNSFLTAFENIDHELMQITRLYDFSFLYKLRVVYLPLINKSMLLALSNSLSLAFKVSVMAEILGQVSVGIGKQIYFAKINYLMGDVFAWTIIIIIISAIIDLIFKIIIKKMKY